MGTFPRTHSIVKSILGHDFIASYKRTVEFFGRSFGTDNFLRYFLLCHFRSNYDDGFNGVLFAFSQTALGGVLE